MKIQAIAIAAALLAGTAFAATPTDTASTTSSTTTTTTTHKHHKTVKTAKAKKPRHHATHHAAAMHHSRHASSAMHHPHHASGMHYDSAMGNSGAPQADANDTGRQARMDEALAKYRQNSN